MYGLSEYPDTRVASMGHFGIYYKIDQDVVIITAFWDNRQDPNKLLQELKRAKQRNISSFSNVNEAIYIMRIM